tara:strand:+ start:82 stop:339 length:258 start_codon:yes stop_codon:yes gene_type:complete
VRAADAEERVTTLPSYHPDAEERVTWRGARAVRWRGVLFVDVATFCAADTFDTLVVWRSAEARLCSRATVRVGVKLRASSLTIWL